MKTKEEVIKEAWGNIDDSNKEVWASYWNYEKAKEHGIDESGGILVKGYDSFDGESFSYLRPKSLQGIEDNNGWIKIDSEKDLPKELIGRTFVYTNKGNVYNYSQYIQWFSISETETITHYKIISEINPPLY